MGCRKQGRRVWLPRSRILGGKFWNYYLQSRTEGRVSAGNSEHIIYEAAEAASFLNRILYEPANKAWKFAIRPGLHNKG